MPLSPPNRAVEVPIVPTSTRIPVFASPTRVLILVRRPISRLPRVHLALVVRGVAENVETKMVPGPALGPVTTLQGSRATVGYRLVLRRDLPIRLEASEETPPRLKLIHLRLVLVPT